MTKTRRTIFYEVQQSNYKVLCFIRQSRLYPNIQKRVIFSKQKYQLPIRCCFQLWYITVQMVLMPTFPFIFITRTYFSVPFAHNYSFFSFLFLIAPDYKSTIQYNINQSINTISQKTKTIYQNGK